MNNAEQFLTDSNLYKRALADLIAIARDGNPYGIREYIGEMDYHNPELSDIPVEGMSYHPAIVKVESDLRERIGMQTNDPERASVNWRKIESLCETIAVYTVFARPERISK